MQVRSFSVFLFVLYDQDREVLFPQSGPRRPLETLDDFFDLFFRRPVLRRKGDHGRRIGIFVAQGVHQVGKKYRVTPPHDHLFFLPFF